MDIEVVDPELRAPVRKLPNLDASKSLLRTLGRVGPRLMRTHRPEGGTTRWVQDGSLRVRIYRPGGSDLGPGLLWIHGGGLVIGSAKQDDPICAGTAETLGITVVSVEYRMAPESPFPAALDDAFAAWEWVQRHGPEWGVDPSRVCVGGESAGAGIAAGLVQRLHDSSVVQPVAQWLFAPMLDDRTAARRELDELDHWVWNNRANRFGWTSYLGSRPGAADIAPYAVPARRRDLSGLPPAWLCVGDIELFHDEVVEYADRLLAAGVPVTLDIVPGAPHGFENWAAQTSIAMRLLERARAWLDVALTSRPGTP